MPSNPFPPINYPPGSLNDPNAPWNQKDYAICFKCGVKKDLSDMSKEEWQSFDDNADGEFLCDKCYAEEGDFED